MSLINEMKLLLGKTSQYDYLLQEINDLQDIIQEQHVRLETEISYLNLSISKEDLFSLTFPFQTEKAWATIKETFEKNNCRKKSIVTRKTSNHEKYKATRARKRTIKTNKFNKRGESISRTETPKRSRNSSSQTNGKRIW